MAGIKGMGSPNQAVKPISPELNIPAPEGMNFQAPTDSYVESAPIQQIAQDDQSALDEIFGQSSNPLDDQAALDEIFGVSKTPEEFTMDQPSALDRIFELPARAKASLQVTDKETQQSLEGSFGKENVRKRNDSIEYKGNDNKWRVWDAGTTVEDFTVDMLRPVVEEVPASLATLAAVVPSVAAMISSGGIAIPAGVAATAAARSGGALLGQATADFMQSLTGVERDKDRSAVLEYGLTAVLAPASGLLADYATKKIAQSAARSGVKKLLPANELYKEEITGIKEGLEKVKSLGGMENIPGTDTPLMLSQLNPSNPIARELTESASSLNGYKQAQEQITQGFSDSSVAFAKTLGNITPESMSTGKQFKNYVEESIAKEGALIGEVRKSFKADAGDVALRIPDMSKRVEDFAVSVGFDKVQAGSKNFKSQWADNLISEGYNSQAAKVIADKTDKVLTEVVNSNGRIKADKLLGMYEELNGVYRNLAKRGMDADPLFKSKIGELRRIVTDQLNTSIGEVAGGDVGKSYMKSLAKYSELVTAGDEFAGLLDKNSLASHSLSKAIFNKGANGLDSLEAAKVLLRDRPDLLSEVKGSYLQGVMANSMNDVNKVDWVKFNKQVQSLGPEMLESAFGKSGLDGLKAYEIVGKAIQAGDVGASNSASRSLLLKNLALAGKSVLATGNASLELLKQVDANGAFAEIISKEGIDNFLKTAPKDSKPILKKILSGFQQAALRSAQVTEIPIRRTGKDMSKEAANEKNK